MHNQIAALTDTIPKHHATLKHRCKADIFAVILETAASGQVQKSKAQGVHVNFDRSGINTAF